VQLAPASIVQCQRWHQDVTNVTPYFLSISLAVFACSESFTQIKHNTLLTSPIDANLLRLALNYYTSQETVAPIDTQIIMVASVNRSASEEKQRANGHSRRLSDAVHSIEQKIEEQVDLAARNPAEERKGGYLLLIICVGGIYASL
jgi:hypothetical protein